MSTEKKTEITETKSTVETHAPDRPEVRGMSESDQQKAELGAQAEHEHGEKREEITRKVMEKDSREEYAS